MVYPDLSQISSFSQAGVTRAQYAIISSADGLPMGPTGSIAAGADAGMGVYVAVKNATSNIGQPRVVNATGDNGRFLHQYIFNPAELGLIDLSFGAFDQDVYARWTGTKRVNVGDFSYVGVETNQAANSVQTCLLLTADNQNAASAYNGQAGYTSYFYPIVSVYFLGDTMTEVSAADFNWRGIPTQPGKTPWGDSFTVSTNGFTRSKSIQLTSRYPVTMHTFVSNGATLSFYLSYTPLQNQTGYTFHIWKYTTAGVLTKLTSSDFTVDVGTKRVTLGSAGTSGDKFLVLYDTMELLLA